MTVELSNSTLTILLIAVIIIIVVISIELPHASRTRRQLRPRVLGVANAVDFLPVAVEVPVARAGGVDHGLADRAALRGDVVVVEFLREGKAGEAGEAGEEEEGGFVVHFLVGWLVGGTGGLSCIGVKVSMSGV